MAEESLITDEMRATIGKEGEPSVLEVDKTTIRWFARAVGHVDLIYYDEAYAQSKGHRSIVAPPGFLGQPVYIPQEGLTGASLPGAARLLGSTPRRVLNGGTEFEYYGEEGLRRRRPQEGQQDTRPSGEGGQPGEDAGHDH